MRLGEGNDNAPPPEEEGRTKFSRKEVPLDWNVHIPFATSPNAPSPRQIPLRLSSRNVHPGFPSRYGAVLESALRCSSVASLDALREYLNALVDRHERPAFLDDDPLSIPHAFDDRRDQEVIGLYAALLAWGRRDVLLRKLGELCERMNHAPYRFVRTFDPANDAAALSDFVHRTFQPIDAIWLTTNLRTALDRYETVEGLFKAHWPGERENPETFPVAAMLQGVSTTLLTINDDTPQRLRKHLARPKAGSACKRLNMYLRWMVRPGSVDLNLWSFLDPADLMMPVDVHVGRQARSLGLLHRKSNDWTAVRRLTAICRHFCASDPARYDFAFFGVGAQEESLDARFTGANRVDRNSLPTPR